MPSELGQGSLSSPLDRLECRGWIQAEWARAENNRRANFIHLLGPGRNSWSPNSPTGTGLLPPSHWCRNKCLGKPYAARSHDSSAFLRVAQALGRFSTTNHSFTRRCAGGNHYNGMTPQGAIDRPSFALEESSVPVRRTSCFQAAYGPSREGIRTCGSFC